MRRSYSILGRLRAARATTSEYFRKRPFTRVMVIASGVVVSLATALEYVGRRRKEPKAFRLFPTPAPPLSSSLEPRTTELDRLENAFEGGEHCSVLLAGASLSGKTELARQYAERFVKISSARKFMAIFSPFKKQRCHVLTAQANTPHNLALSLRAIASRLGVVGDVGEPRLCLEAIEEALDDESDWLFVFDHVSEEVLLKCPGFVEWLLAGRLKGDEGHRRCQKLVVLQSSGAETPPLLRLPVVEMPGKGFWTSDQIFPKIRELAEKDPKWERVLSLLGSIAPNCPLVPVSLLQRSACKGSVSPQLPPALPKEDKVTTEDLKPSLEDSSKPISNFKNKLETVKKDVADVITVAQIKFGLGKGKQKAGQGTEPSGRPLTARSELEDFFQLSFIRCLNVGGSLEVVHVNHVIQKALAQLIQEVIIPRREIEYLRERREAHSRSFESWFRSFDENQSLVKGREKLAVGHQPESFHGVALEPYEVSHLTDMQQEATQLMVDECSAQGQVGIFTRGILLSLMASSLSNPPTLALNLLLAQAASYMDVLSNTQEAKTRLERACALTKVQSDPRKYAQVLSDLALIHFHMKEMEESQKLLQQAVQIHESLQSPRLFGSLPQKEQIEITLGLSQALSRLGSVYGAMGDIAHSRECCENAFLLLQYLPPDDSGSYPHVLDLASSIIDLGEAYLSEGKYDYAKKVLELGLNVNKNVRGEGHPEVSRAMTTLGVVYWMLGDVNVGEKMRKEAEKIKQLAQII
eukprot:m.311397 g.311397  ORF g.311397 m.311397 type:complete len:752 (+) comp68025_c0_seq1:13-2268(+)